MLLDQGGFNKDKGLIPRVIEEIFSHYKDSKCDLKLSYIEIYNDQVTDLLDL